MPAHSRHPDWTRDCCWHCFLWPMSLSRWLCFSRDQVYRVSHSGRKARYCPTRVVSFEHLSVQDCGSLCFVYETTRFERREPSGRAPLSDAEPARVYNQAVPRLFKSSSHFDPNRVRQGCCLFGDELEIQYIWEYDVRLCSLDSLDHTLFPGDFDPSPFSLLFYPSFFPPFLFLFIPEIHLWPSFYEPTKRRLYR